MMTVTERLETPQSPICMFEMSIKWLTDIVFMIEHSLLDSISHFIADNILVVQILLIKRWCMYDIFNLVSRFLLMYETSIFS